MIRDTGRKYLDGNPIAFSVPLPHCVWIVDEEVAVGQGSRQTDQLERVRVDVEAGGGGARGDGDHGLGGPRPGGRGHQRLLGYRHRGPVPCGVILNCLCGWDGHVVNGIGDLT